MFFIEACIRRGSVRLVGRIYDYILRLRLAAGKSSEKNRESKQNFHLFSLFFSFDIRLIYVSVDTLRQDVVEGLSAYNPDNVAF